MLGQHRPSLPNPPTSIVCVSRLEQAKEDESKDALKDLVNLVTCLTTYGVTELKPAGLTTGAPFLLPGFVLPQPSGKGVCYYCHQFQNDFYFSSRHLYI